VIQYRLCMQINLRREDKWNFPKRICFPGELSLEPDLVEVR
jgi:hypothetical protein